MHNTTPSSITYLTTLGKIRLHAIAGSIQGRTEGEEHINPGKFVLTRQLSPIQGTVKKKASLQQCAYFIAGVQCCVLVFISYFRSVSWDKTQQVAKAIPSSFGFSS